MGELLPHRIALVIRIPRVKSHVNAVKLWVGMSMVLSESSQLVLDAADFDPNIFAALLQIEKLCGWRRSGEVEKLQFLSDRRFEIDRCWVWSREIFRLCSSLSVSVDGALMRRAFLPLIDLSVKPMCVLSSTRSSPPGITELPPMIGDF